MYSFKINLSLVILQTTPKKMLFYCLFIAINFLPLLVSANEDVVLPCVTPNNETALCVSLFTCPILMSSLCTLTPQAVQFVKLSICCDGTPGDLKVCCGTYGNYTGYNFPTPSPTLVVNITTRPETNTTQMMFATKGPDKPEMQTLNISNVSQESHRNFVKKKLLPSRKYCGLQHTDDRFYNEMITALDEFPWLVDLPFLDDEDEDPLQFLDRCNGVLISNRYVLTIGTCANYLSRVRLGQYQTNTTVSCIQNSSIPDCTEPKYYINVEEEIHRTNTKIAQHDFALLRLAEKVSYSDFVRPICLPVPEPGEPHMRDSVILTGWGALEEKQEIAKKRLIYNISNNLDQCFKLDSNGLKEFTSNVSVACLVPDEKNVDVACTGDEGGPLLYSQRFQWFVGALVTKVYDSYDEFKAGLSHNFTDEMKCSNKLPISGIKITPDVLDWIMDKMRL